MRDAPLMQHLIPPEDSGVPQKIQRAEEWRLLGKQLKAISPELFERMFAMLVLSLPDEDDEKTTSGCLLT